METQTQTEEAVEAIKTTSVERTSPQVTKQKTKASHHSSRDVGAVVVTLKTENHASLWIVETISNNTTNKKLVNLINPDMVAATEVEAVEASLDHSTVAMQEMVVVVSNLKKDSEAPKNSPLKAKPKNLWHQSEVVLVAEAATAVAWE